MSAIRSLSPLPDQQVSYLKRSLKLKLHDARNIVAKTNRFEHWHELEQAFTHHRNDVRVLGASVNVRGGPATLTRLAVDAARAAGRRFAASLGHADGEMMWARSLGFNSSGAITPFLHIDAAGVSHDGNEPPRMQFNLFDGESRLWVVTGTPHGGKSSLLMKMLQNHSAGGGHVIVLSVDVHEYGMSPDEAQTLVQIRLQAIEPRLRICVGIDPSAERPTLLPYPQHPGTVIAIDEWWNFCQRYGFLRAVNYVGALIAGGHAMIVVDDEVPRHDWTQGAPSVRHPAGTRYLAGLASRYSDDGRGLTTFLSKSAPDLVGRVRAIAPKYTFFALTPIGHERFEAQPFVAPAL